MVLLGPGLSQAAPTVAFLDALLESLVGILRGLACDTDVLNLLARIPTYWSRLLAQTVLAPHPGETARLT